MSRHIAFLRAINVGGRRVRMDELRSIFETGPYRNVSTLLASGNVLFESSERDTVAMEARIETMLSESLGFQVDTFVRTPRDIVHISEQDVFSAGDLGAAGAFNIGLLKQPLSPEQVDVLQSFESMIDRFATREKEVYWLCTRKQSESDFTNARFEKAAGVRATFRGHKTIARILEKVSV